MALDIPYAYATIIIARRHWERHAGMKRTVDGAKTLSASRRQRAAKRRVLEALDNYDSAELEIVARSWEKAQRHSTPAFASPTLLAAAGVRPLDREQRAGIEAAALRRFFEFRRALLNGSLGTSEVAELLGTSRQTPHDRVKAGTLLAVRDGGRLRFPSWQFDPHASDGVVSGLSAVVRALDAPPLSRIAWFTRANPYLDGSTPLQALKDGHVERVLAAARAVGVS
jgi:excisionase family DNA binding protein